MNDFHFELSRSGVRKLLKSKEMQNGLSSIAFAAQSRLGDGYTAIYGQLKELNFKTGDTVEAGQVIGYVSEPTKYYSTEGSNLYFELQKDGKPVNPKDFLPELPMDTME